MHFLYPRRVLALLVAFVALFALAQPASAADTQPPTAPSLLKAVPGTNGVNLSWQASRDNIGVKYYLATLAGQTKKPTATKVWFGTLKPATTYTATIRAVDAAGNKSAPTSVTFRTLSATGDKTPPSAPTALTATPAQTSAALTWTASTDNIAVTGYRVTLGATTQTVTTTTATLTGLTPATTYTATVIALDAAGNTSPAATVTFTTLTPPDTTPPTAPTALTATPAQTSAALTWTASTDNIAVTGYRVTLGATTQTVTTTTATLTGLTPATTYTATVLALDAAGNTSPAATVTFTTLTPPDTTPPTAPTGFTFTARETSADVTWLPSTDNVGVVSYTLTAAGATYTVTTNAATLTGLAPSTTVRVTIYASDAAGNTSVTVPFSVRTPGTPDTQAPTAPQVSTVAGTTRVSVTVGGSTDDQAVVRYTVTLGGVTQTATEPATLLFTGLTPDTTYPLQASARDAAGNVSSSTATTVTTRPPGNGTDTQPPDQPQDFTVRAGSTAGSFRWTPAADDGDVDHYTLTVAGTSQDVTTPLAFVDSLDPGTPYDATLVAVDAAGNASLPATLSFRTSTLAEGAGLHGTIAWFGRAASQASMDEALASSLVDGISMFARWTDVTTDGVTYDFSPFDRARTAAGRAGKPWAGMIIYGVAGNGMPDYVMAALPPDEVITTEDGTRPAFWSATAQASARALTSALAARYGSDRNLVQWRVTGLWSTNGEPWFLGGTPGRAAYLAAYQASHPGATFADLQAAYNAYEQQIWADAAAAWPARIQLAQAAGDAVNDVVGSRPYADPDRHPQRLATWAAIRAGLGDRMVGQFNGVDPGDGASGYGVWLPAAFGPTGRYPGRIGGQPRGGVTSSDIRLTAEDFREMTRLMTDRGYSYSEFYAADILYAVRGNTDEARHMRDTLMLYQGAWAP